MPTQLHSTYNKEYINMKRNTIFATVCVAILASCSSQPTEKDYIDAFIDLAGDNVANKESIAIAHSQNISLADSMAYITFTLAQEYQDLLNEKKLAWENKIQDCEKDEKANILRHEDYMKKYEAAKRQYGNSIKHKSKIEGYLKAAQKLPSNHEEYLKFDRSRSYSFTRDAENLQADYEQHLALTLQGYAAQHPSMLVQGDRTPDEVVATVYNISYTNSNNESVTEQYIFNNNPVVALERLSNESTNIINYNQTDSNQEAQ